MKDDAADRQKAQQLSDSVLKFEFKSLSAGGAAFTACERLDGR